MLTTTLLMLLTTAPQTPGFLSEGAPRRIRLVADEADAPPTYVGWSKKQLKAEYDRLDSIRPGLGLPIGLMGGGGGALIVGAYFLFLSALVGGFLGGSTTVGFMVVFGVIAIVGAGLLIMGGILLGRALPGRRAIGKKMDQLDQRLKQDSDDAPPVRDTPENDLQAPPPPPPPGALPPPQVMMPAFPITLARF